MSTQLLTVAIDDKGVISGPIAQMTETQKRYFYSSLAKQKVGDKTILELAKSTDAVDKQKAIWATKQIVKSILEAEVVRFDAQDTITGIYQ
jgi:hypothetical protein